MEIDTKSHKLIRGARIFQQMNKEHLLETSYSTLDQRTRAFVPRASSTARQNAIGPIQVTKMELIPARPSQQLQVRAEVSSNNSKYSPSVSFEGVVFDDSDQPDNITFTGVDNKEYHINSIELNSLNVKVKCNCLDFYYRFAPFNNNDGSLLGNPPPPYQRKTDTRPPANIQKTPGVCKHIMKVITALKDVDIVR